MTLVEKQTQYLVSKTFCDQKWDRQMHLQNANHWWSLPLGYNHNPQSLKFITNAFFKYLQLGKKPRKCFQIFLKNDRVTNEIAVAKTTVIRTRMNGYKTLVTNLVARRLLLIANNFVTVRAVAKRLQNCHVSSHSLVDCNITTAS